MHVPWRKKWHKKHHPSTIMVAPRKHHHPGTLFIQIAVNFLQGQWYRIGVLSLSLVLCLGVVFQLSGTHSLTNPPKEPEFPDPMDLLQQALRHVQPRPPHVPSENAAQKQPILVTFASWSGGEEAYFCGTSALGVSLYLCVVS